MESEKQSQNPTATRPTRRRKSNVQPQHRRSQPPNQKAKHHHRSESVHCGGSKNSRTSRRNRIPRPSPFRSVLQRFEEVYDGHGSAVQRRTVHVHPRLDPSPGLFASMEIAPNGGSDDARRNSFHGRSVSRDSGRD